jgi:hypothetical protein
MKKNLWILLALAALIAMFVIAGCAPKPSSPTPTPTPTASPTVPPADTAAPKVVSTEVFKYYAAGCGATCIDKIYEACPDGSETFKIVITFDENIDPLKSSCLLNPANWYVEVTNDGRIVDPLLPLSTITGDVIVWGAEISGKQVIVTAGVAEDGENEVFLDPSNPLTPTLVPYYFCGLICNANDAALYAKNVNGPYNGWAVKGVIPAPEYADLVYWEIGPNCVVSDELGNVNCGYNGSDCCLEATCDTCDTGCPFQDPTCVSCVNPCE